MSLLGVAQQEKQNKKGFELQRGQLTSCVFSAGKVELCMVVTGTNKIMHINVFVTVLY